MLGMAREAQPQDLCICLISGGGSALLPAPVDEITLADKQHVTRFLSAAGADIQQLNTVRKQLSQIKGGGLAAACGAGHLVTLIISDVLGDPLDMIASGPTVEDTTTAEQALDVLLSFQFDQDPESGRIMDYLRQSSGQKRETVATSCQTSQWVIGNNATAVMAAGEEAERRGYQHAMQAATASEGLAEDVGRHLAQMAMRMQQDSSGPDCLITGGEPTVELADKAIRGRGGRNQQLVLAAYQRLCDQSQETLQGISLLSGGTDGEDGPTNAAGALIDADVARRIRDSGIDVPDCLRRNDAYTLFEEVDGLIMTGPTHTNVCDLRVVTVGKV